jgi:hypothetical protein
MGRVKRSVPDRRLHRLSSSTASSPPSSPGARFPRATRRACHVVPQTVLDQRRCTSRQEQVSTWNRSHATMPSARSARRRIEPLCLQDRPHCGGSDPVAETGQLTVDAPVSPGRVLRGEAFDQGPQTGRGRRATRRPGRRGGPPQPPRPTAAPALLPAKPLMTPPTTPPITVPGPGKTLPMAAPAWAPTIAPPQPPRAAGPPSTTAVVTVRSTLVPVDIPGCNAWSCCH